MTSRAWLVAPLFLALNLAPVAGAASHSETPQKPYALIFGTVWGPNARPVYGVKLKIRRQNEKKARWEAYSDHHGEFAQRVPAGKADYVISADLKGMKTQDGAPLHAEEVHIHIENDERVDTGVHLTEESSSIPRPK